MGWNPPVLEVATPNLAKRKELQVRRASGGSLAPALCFSPETVSPALPSPSPFGPSSKPGGPAPLLPAIQGGLLAHLGLSLLWEHTTASDSEGLEWGALVVWLHLTGLEPQAQRE